MAADEDMEDPEDASEDPEPIMINSAEAADPRLVSVLESEVGLAPEYWDAAVWQRYTLDIKADLSAKQPSRNDACMHCHLSLPVLVKFKVIMAGLLMSSSGPGCKRG